MGKSVATVDLLKRFHSKFKLVIAMIGTPSCQPTLNAMMNKYWDSRFFYSTWDTGLVTRLMKQQEELRERGIERHVAILVDDIVLTSEAAEQIAHLAMRGRHWLISLFMCAVSWSTLPKRVRRSLDICMVFSCPMASDIKLLCGEYASNSTMAEFMMRQLAEHQCLVLETVTKVQKLYVWRSDLHTRESLQIEWSRDDAKLQKKASVDSPVATPGIHHSKGISEPLNRTELREFSESDDEV